MHVLQSGTTYFIGRNADHKASKKPNVNCLIQTKSTGFLKTGSRGSAQGNFGLMDLVAGLHWLRENLPAFGGDPESITVMGHGTGAALANYIAVSPVAKGKVDFTCTSFYLLVGQILPK